MSSQGVDLATFLTKQCSGQLDESFADLKKRISQCKISLPDFLPSLARAITHGFQGTPDELRSYIAKVHLADLMLVAACMQQDDAAVRFFSESVLPRVGQALRAGFSKRASPAVIVEVIEQLPGHCFDVTTTGSHPKMPRLASYFGRSSLSTWLYATASRIMLDVMRQRLAIASTIHGQDLAELTSREMTPDNIAVCKESHALAERLRKQLVESLREALEMMPAKRRLASVLFWHFGLSASEVARRMQVSRPRVTELLSEARGELRQRSCHCLDQIARESACSFGDLQDILVTHLGEVLRGELESGLEGMT